jgi:rod shape-determining protein MreC
MITWDGVSSLNMRYVPAAQAQKKGDTVLTSNYSSLFPENIIIGTIAEIKEEQGTLFYSIKVEPSVNFGTLEEAFVVLYSPDQSRLELERKLIEPNQTDTERNRGSQQ